MICTRGERGAVWYGFWPKPNRKPHYAVFENQKPQFAVSNAVRFCGFSMRCGFIWCGFGY